MLPFNSRTFYFLTVLLILVLIFYVVPSFKSKGKTAASPITIESVERASAGTVVEDAPPSVEVRSVQLDVPFFKQEYIRSCEEASLRMVLAFYGIETNDMEIVKRVGYDPHPWNTKNNIWDDPNKMFVGSIDDPSKNGYGTFAPAIASAAKTFGRDSESYLGVSEQFLAEQIYNNHPVIVWGFTAPPLTKYYWNTKEGKKISTYRGEHARVIVGVFGDVSKPTGFLLNDPLTKDGKEGYWSTERLMTHMN